MNDRLRRLLIIFGPIIGAILLFYVVNAAIGTYTVGVEDLRHERHAEATAEAAQAAGEGATDETATDAAATDEVTATEEISATETVTE